MNNEENKNENLEEKVIDTNFEELKEPVPVTTEISTESKTKKGKNKPVILAVVLAICFAVAFAVFSNSKIGLAKSVNNTMEEYQNEFEKISKSNDILNKVDGILEDNYLGNINYTSSYLGSIDFNIANDDSNNIFALTGSYNDLINAEIYLTNDTNYLTVNGTSYNFDTKNGLNTLANWFVAESADSLDEQTLQLLSDTEGIDLNYDLLSGNDSSDVDTEKFNKELEDAYTDYFTTLVKDAELVETESTLFVDGEDKTVNVTEIPVDLNTVLRDVFAIQKEISLKYADESAKSTMEETYELRDEELENLLSENSFDKTLIRLYSYKNFIVKFELDVTSTYIPESTTEQFTLYIANNSTTDMLNYIEIGISTDYVSAKTILENDLFNEDYSKIVLTTEADGEVTTTTTINWDYTSSADNVSLTYEDLYYGESLESTFTLANTENGILFEYIFPDSSDSISANLEKTSEAVTLPTESTYLYDMTYQDFVLQLFQMLLGGMFN